MAVIYLCPADKRLLCPWEGCAKDIKQHFENEHHGLLFHTNFVEIDLNILDKNRLLSLNGDIYLVQSDINNNSLLIKLRYLGANDVAANLHYDLGIIVNSVSYKYDPVRKISCVVPRPEGWEVDLPLLEQTHGKVQSVVCTIILHAKIDEDNNKIKRKNSTRSLKINNSFVESHACDLIEEGILGDIRTVDEKLEQLSKEKDNLEFLKESQDESTGSESDGELSVIECPLVDKQRESLTEILPDIREGNESNDKELIPEAFLDTPEEHNLSCSNCTLDMLPPIYLCGAGHPICSWCVEKPCQICEQPVTTKRSMYLENISRTHKHVCKYFSSGCLERFAYNELRAHETKCAHCKYKCPERDCPYEGRFQDFHNHLKVVHSSIKIQMQTRIDFPKNTIFFVVHTTVGIFYCSSLQKNESITWNAHFCGPKERQFFCELTFKGSKHKDPIFLKRKENVYELKKSISDLKKYKAKEKYASLTITSFDS